MIRTRALMSLVLGLAFSACLDDPEDLGETTSELSVTNWSPKELVGADVQQAYRSAQVAAVNGVTYMVHSGRCGAWSCGGAGPANDLWWTKLTPNGWTNDIKIPSQKASHKVSLAGFNGKLYMLHSGDSDTTAVWISSFNTSTEQWSTNYKLGFTSKGGPPAIAAFNGKLHLVGSNPSDNRLWAASMSTSEVFTNAVTLNQWSASRSSLAVFQNRLFVAHRDLMSATIVYSSSADGTNWNAYQLIPGGANSGWLEGLEPVIAAHDGYLHLVHRRPGSSSVFWTYFNGSSWPTEVTIGTLASSYDPSLANGGSGLVLVSTTDSVWNGIIETRTLYTSQYTSPFLPPDPGPCCIGVE
jgi:hypothetical protein